MRFTLAVLIFSLFLSFSGKTTHIVGGEIYYEHLGNNRFKITMFVYRDCFLGQAEFDRFANISVYEDSNKLVRVLHPRLGEVTNLPSDIADSCYYVPSGVCVERAVYSLEATLPQNNSGYFLSWQRCCRNSSIKNLNNPGDWGSTITTYIPSGLVAPFNSSPVFKNRPPLAICLGSDFTFDHSATDLDGDSLSYTLCEVYHGGGKDMFNPNGPTGPVPSTPTPPPYRAVGWSGSYGPLNPIAANVPFKVDPVTGVFSGTPNQIGQFVFGVCVDEYRNGKYIGSSRREYQVNVKPCQSATRANMDIPSKCEGLDIQFNNTSQRSKTFHWDFGLGSHVNDTSQQRNPSFTFPDSGTYTVQLVANPGWRCADTITKKITLYHALDAAIKPFEGKCISDPVFNFEVGGRFAPYSKIYWNFGTQASIQTDSSINPTGIQYPDTGRYPIRLRLSHKGCTSAAEDTVIVYPNLIPKFFIRGAKGCTPLEVQLEDRSVAWTKVKRFWKVDNKTYHDSIQRLSITEPGEYVLSHQAYTLDGCKDTSEKQYRIVNVLQGPEAGFVVSSEKVSIYDPYISLSDQSLDGDQCQLFFGDEKVSYKCNDDHVFEKPGLFKISQVVTNNNGCSDTASVNIEVENEFAFFIPSTFTPNNDGLNEVFKPILVGVKEIEFTVYDRWGNVVFYTENQEEGWDGTLKNREGNAPIGTYVYKIRVKDFVDEFHFYSNNVYLTR
jgi:gliding motility-associated-like protein